MSFFLKLCKTWSHSLFPFLWTEPLMRYLSSEICKKNCYSSSLDHHIEIIWFWNNLFWNWSDFYKCEFCSNTLDNRFVWRKSNYIEQLLCKQFIWLTRSSLPRFNTIWLRENLEITILFQFIFTPAAKVCVFYITSPEFLSISYKNVCYQFIEQQYLMLINWKIWKKCY